MKKRSSDLVLFKGRGQERRLSELPPCAEKVAVLVIEAAASIQGVAVREDVVLVAAELVERAHELDQGYHHFRLVVPDVRVHDGAELFARLASR